VARRLQPYRAAVRAENPQGGLAVYPGSSLIALHLLRGQDSLIANELHPEDAAQLRSSIGRDRRAKVLELDAWVALKSLLPPKERRGVILIDPPFEAANELERMTAGLQQGLERFATGIYLAWYPIKDPKPVARFHAALAALGSAKILRIELMLEPPRDVSRLNGCGLVVINPPYPLEGELTAILPELSRRLASGRAPARYRLDWIEPAVAPVRTAAPAREAKRRTRTRS
jgi:23S rRNA (adenine2030-N6)-methyltransferase